MPLYIEADVSNKQDYITMNKDEEEEYEDYEVVQIETIEPIFQNSQKERCNVILQEFKKIIMFSIRAEYSALFY